MWEGSSRWGVTSLPFLYKIWKNYWFVVRNINSNKRVILNIIYNLVEITTFASWQKWAYDNTAMMALFGVWYGNLTWESLLW